MLLAEDNTSGFREFIEESRKKFIDQKTRHKLLLNFCIQELYNLRYIMHMIIYIMRWFNVIEKEKKVENSVRNFRRALDLTQQELADKINVHRQTIVSIEKRKYEPTIGIVLRLSHELNVPVEKLFFFEKNE